MAFSTPAANPFGSFAQQQASAPAASSSAFGVPPAPPAPPPPPGGALGSTGGGLFGTAKPAGAFGGGGGFGSTGTGGLFGTSQAPASGGGLFGSSAPATGGRVFGTASTGAFGASTTAPAAGGGAFGQSGGTGSSSFGGFGGGAAGSSLFGSRPAGAFGAQPAAGASAFGATQPTAGSLFGTSQPTGTGAFGASQPAGSNAFGGFGSSSTAAPAAGAFGSSFLGQPNATTATQPGGAPGFTLHKTTRFNDLPPEIKKQIEEIDLYIQEESLVGEELRSREFGALIKEGRSQLRDLSSDAASLSSQVSHTSSSLQTLRKVLDTLTTALVRSGTLIDASKAPQDRELALRASRFARFPFEWFDERCQEMERRLARIERGMEDVAGILRGYGDRGNPAAIVPALRAQHATFMSLASQVAILDGQMTSLKDDFREMWRRQVGGAGSARDPFEEAVFLKESGVGEGFAGMRL